MNALTTAGLLLVLANLTRPAAGQEGLTEAAVADSARKYKFLAKTARDKGDNEAALGYYRQLVRYEPGYQRGHFHLGQILFEMGDNAGAKEALLAAARLDSLHTNTNLALYQVYRLGESPDSAWAALDRAMRVKSDGSYDGYRREVADLYRRQGRTADAVSHYEALVGDPAALEPADADLIELIVGLRRELGQLEAALEWQRRLIGLRGGGEGADTSVAGRREALSAMVELMVQKGDLQAAIGTLRDLAEVDHAGRYSHYHRMERLAEEANDRAARLEGLRGMVAANPRDLESLVALVEIYLRDRDLARAARSLGDGLRANPDDPQLHLLRGDLFVLEGNEEKALEAFAVAMADPGWHDVAQQRIWQIRPPETEEERLKREFFGGSRDAADSDE